jgi:hypothetical protein
VLSIVVRSYSGAEALTVSLRAAFPGVTAGLIGEAIVVAPPGDLDSAAVADAAGAALVVESTFVEGFAAARLRKRHAAILLVDGGAAIDQTSFALIAARLPLRDGAALATPPVQMGWRGLAQRLLGRVTRDQALVLSETLGETIAGDPWRHRYGRALTLIGAPITRPAL